MKQQIVGYVLIFGGWGWLLILALHDLALLVQPAMGSAEWVTWLLRLNVPSSIWGMNAAWPLLAGLGAALVGVVLVKRGQRTAKTDRSEA